MGSASFMFYSGAQFRRLGFSGLFSVFFMFGFLS